MRALAAVLAASAALVACSGGDDDEEFATRAAAICKEKRAEIATVRRPGALILFADYLDQVLPTLREQREDVGDLAGADSDGAEKMLDGWDAVLAGLAGMQKAARAGSDIGIAIGLRRAAAAEREADAAARALGVRECVGFYPFTRS